MSSSTLLLFPDTSVNNQLSLTVLMVLLVGTLVCKTEDTFLEETAFINI